MQLLQVVEPALSSATHSAAVSLGTPSNMPLCLFPKRLPSLLEALVPDVQAGVKDYAALFSKIRELDNGRAGQCFISFPSATANGYGRFICRDDGFTEPKDKAPYDIGIARLQQIGVPATGGDAKSPYLIGRLVLAKSECGVELATGDFTMRALPLWAGVHGEEIYEVKVAFDVRYGVDSKTFGEGSSVATWFWAVRSKDGEAMGEKDAAYLANFVGPDDDDLSEEYSF
ncbi:hypothetical protein DXG01_005734 [Tephrocybe rancida]|nr:hypothetical protein DXG01_005734 [Tephrocybe rancida]